MQHNRLVVGGPSTLLLEEKVAKRLISQGEIVSKKKNEDAARKILRLDPAHGPLKSKRKKETEASRTRIGRCLGKTERFCGEKVGRLKHDERSGATFKSLGRSSFPEKEMWFEGGSARRKCVGGLGEEGAARL